LGGGFAAAQKTRCFLPLPTPHSGVGRGQGGGAKFSIRKFLKSDSCQWFYFRFIFLIFISLCICSA